MSNASTKYYFVFVWGSVNPEIHGPFKTAEERYEAVLKTAKGEGDEHGYFWLDDTDGKLEIGTYSTADLGVEA